jgi:PAS domain S-box-containing protein
MSHSRSSPLTRYGIALLAVAGAIAIRALLTPWIGSAFPLATMFSAVAVVVWAAGALPALVTALVGWFAAGLVFLGSFTILNGGSSEFVGLSVYLVSCASIIVLGEAMRAAQRKMEAQQQDLSSTNLALASKIEAQSLLAAIVASSEDAIISKTLDGVITSWNKGAERLFGWTADEAIGQSIQLIVPAELRDQEQEILQRLRRGEPVEHLDVERLRKDGSRVHISVTISPVYDRHRHIIGASKTARDVTARKAWEDQLQRNEEAQRLLVGIHDASRGLEDPAIVMREIATRVGLHFNAARCAYGDVGPNQDELTIARGYATDVPSVERRYSLDAFGPGLAAALRAGDTVVINDVRVDPLTASPKAQDTFTAMQLASLVCVPLVRSSRLVAILLMGAATPRPWTADEAGLLEQVAERTLFAVESARAAAALRESRDVMQLAMSTARMGAWSRDLVLDTVWLSPELADIYGFAPDDTTYDRTRLAGMVRPEERERLSALIAEALRERRDYAVEFEFRHAGTGEWRWMEARGRAVYGNDGTPTMLYGLGIDITERRLAVEALQDADRRKDEFLATLAHELRNPLAPISSGLHILRSGKASMAGTALEIMERQVGQMVRLVDDLLDVARITTGKVELRCEPFDLAAAINDAIETCQPALAHREQPFSLATPPQPIHVNADRTRLAQVFANLLNNSSKYSEPGQPIAIAFARDGGEAVVRVRDTGIGIHPEMLPRVFDMFRQADHTGGRSRGGLGIGLSLVKRIIELHGGAVSAHSDGLGLGSEFVVRIPAMAAAQAGVVPDRQSTRSATARRRILVVDDNQDAAEALSALLALSGHETRMAHDGPEAIDLARRFHPDVVFLDIGMPTLDGHETARLIRQQPWGKDMVLVALTGWGQHEDRRRSQDAGFNHHLVKPADPAVVAKLLSSLEAPT